MLMKRLVFFVMLLVAFMPLMAQQRSDAEMESIARQQLMSGKLKGMKAKASATLKRVHNDKAYAVYSPASEEGFVIVSRDDRMQPVLGYSDATFDVATMPCNMKWWLGEVDKAYQRLQKAPGNADYREGPSFDPIIGPEAIEVPMTTKWAQADPYNASLPVADTPTGCVPLAMGQVMNYHQWPMSAKFSGSYMYMEVDEEGKPVLDGNHKAIWHQVDNVLVNSSYTWPLKDAYKLYVDEEGEYHKVETTDEEIVPVARLLRDCGAAVNVQYAPGKDNSGYAGADARDAAYAFSNYFGYSDQAIHYHDRYYFTDKEWRSILVNELRNGCPVLYGGSDYEYSNAHVFIVYGITPEGYMHVNWGWAGLYNGYYHVDDMILYGDEVVPGSDDPTVLEDYRYNHIMVAGIRKEPLPGEHFVSEMYMDGLAAEAFSYNRNKQPHFTVLAENIANDQPADFNGDIYLAVEEDGQETQYSRFPFTNDFFLQSGYYIPEQPMEQDLLLENNHNYRIYFVVRDKKEVDYIPMRSFYGQLYYTVSVNENGVGTFDGPYLFEGRFPGDGVKSMKVQKEDGLTRVYDLQGRAIYTAPAASFNVKDVPGRGVVIVRKGDKATKILR